MIFWLVGTLVSAWARGAMISMVDEADRQGSTSIKSGASAGWKQAMPLTALAIVFALPGLLLAAPMWVGLVLMMTRFSGIYRMMFSGTAPSPEQFEAAFGPIITYLLPAFFCLIPLLCAAAILNWLLSMLHQISARALVLERLGMHASIRRGWILGSREFGSLLLNMVVLFALIVLFMGVAGVPALLLWMPVARSILHGTWNSATMISAIGMALYYLVIALVGGGVLTSFNTTLWTKLYKAMAEKNGQATASPQAA